jgi:hypothetical protein
VRVIGTILSGLLAGRNAAAACSLGCPDGPVARHHGHRLLRRVHLFELKKRSFSGGAATQLSEFGVPPSVSGDRAVTRCRVR